MLKWLPSCLVDSYIRDFKVALANTIIKSTTLNWNQNAHTIIHKS